MNKLSRRFRQLFSKSSRQSRLYRSSRRLRAEQLEGRLLLAGDLLHNDLTPSDVDNDGYVAPIDVLLVINALSQDGAAGEGDTAERPVYLDTNGDGELSPIDVLVPINDLLSGAGEGGDIVSYQPVALATSFVSRPAFGGFRYVENGANDSIVIIGNASWLDAGFAAGGQVLISDSGRFVDTFENPPVPDNQRNFDPDLRIHNNGLYDVISVTADTLTVQGNLITEYPSNVRSTDDSGAPLAGQEVSDSSAFFFRPLDSVSASQTFILAMLVEDLRTMTESGATLPDGSKGVFSATVDVTFDPAAVTPNGSSLSDLRFHNGYTGAASGSFSTPGLLDEAGASAFGGQVGVPTGAREQLLWRTPFTAGTSTADIVFATDPADLSPAHDTLVFGINTAIPPNMIEYQTLSLDIVSDIVANDDLANGQPILTVTEGSGQVSVNVLANDQVFTPAGGTPIITAATQPQSGAGSVTFTQSSLLYTPPTSVSAVTDATFTYTIGNGQGASATATVTVRVNPVNDAPTITAPNSLTTAEDTLLNINGVSVNDADGDDLTVTLSVSNGTVAAGSESGASITLSGTQAVINASLSGLTYDPNPNVDTSDTLVISVTDGIVSPSVTRNVPIDITAVDDPTVLTVPGDQTGFLGNDLIFSTANSNAITVTDPDSTLTVTLSVDQGNLAAGGQSGSSITLSGAASAITSQLDGLVFSFTNAAPFNATLDVSVQGGTPLQESIGITIVPPSTPFAANNSFTFPEDSGIQTLNVLANDIAADGNTLTITGLAVGSQTVSPGGPSAAINSGSLQGTLALASNGMDVTFTPDADANGSFSFTYTIEQSPDPHDEDAVTTATVAVTVTPVNDAPTLAVPGAQTTSEDPSSPLSITGLSVNDIDGDALTVTLGVSNGTLNSAAPLAQSGNSITLTGSIANVNAALATLTYTPSANFNGSDTLSVGVNDGNGGTANGTVGITVTAVNDNPTLTTPGPQQFFRDISNSLSSAISVADIDAGSSNIRVNLTIGTGTLAVAPTSNVQVASITNGISLTGSVANVNAALTSLTYTSGVSGNFTLSVAVNDLGNTGAGGGQDVTGTVAVEVLDFVPATITGTVFADLNNNGSQDADEMGLGGVEVTLSGRDFRNQVVQKVAITEADGSYSFTDIAPNQVGQPYTVTQTLPAFFQANSSTHSVSVNLQGQVTTTGGLSTGNLLPEFADYWDRLGRSIQAPFNSGLLFGFDDMIQDWSTIDGVGWDTSQFTNFRLTLSADGDSGVLTVFDKTIGQDRTRNVSLADGTLTYHGTDVDRIYRVVGSSSSLLGGAAVASMGEGSSVEETSSEEFAAAADVLFGRLGG